MILSTSTQEKLDAWIAPKTWHTKHDLDMKRWYEFVDQYQKDHGFVIDEDMLSEHIAERADCTMNDDLKEIISRRISLAYNILDFLKHTGR